LPGAGWRGAAGIGVRLWNLADVLRVADRHGDCLR
jgi:hypothetical protein